jgi:type VI secretion system secreted protein Hcp
MSQEEANEIVRETQRRHRARRALKLGLPTVAALGAGAAIAVAAIPGNGGVITGCYANPTPNEDGFRENITINGVLVPPGNLRVIDPSIPKPPAGSGGPNVAGECQPGESTITWNQTGPTGPTGSTGSQGSQGPAGGQGAPGNQGAPGTPLVGGTDFNVGGGGGAGLTFLKLDGINGETTDKFHKGEIAVESFSLGLNAGTQAHGSGGGAGKTSIQTFTITKALDKTSPLLLAGAGAGRTYKEAELFFVRKAGGEQSYLKFDFSDVIIAKVSDGTSGGGRPTEEVTFAFQKCTEALIEPNGKTGPSVSFNVSQNLKL